MQKIPNHNTNPGAAEAPQCRDTVHIRRANPLETMGHYNRRQVDPLEVALADPEQREAIAVLSEAALPDAHTACHKREIIELNTDILYRRLGLQDPSLTCQQSEATRALVAAEKEKCAQNPVDTLILGMRLIDLESMVNISRNVDVAHSIRANPTMSEAEKRKNLNMLDTFYETAEKHIIKEGALLLKESQKAHSEEKDEETKKVLRGRMFELFFATYARQNIYEAEERKKSVIVGATEFEDSSASCFKPSNHNYDFLMLDEGGSVQAIYQCKSGPDEEKYAAPIIKINSRSFAAFIHDPDRFIDALQVLVENAPMISEAAMRRHATLLEQLFASNFRHVGSTALTGATQ